MVFQVMFAQALPDGALPNGVTRGDANSATGAAFAAEMNVEAAASSGGAAASTSRLVEEVSVGYGSADCGPMPMGSQLDGTGHSEQVETRSELQQARQEVSTTAEPAGAPVPATMTDAMGQPTTSGYMTPRSVQSMVQTRGAWFSGLTWMEVPSWVSRLGSYVSMNNQVELFPSPLAGSSRSSPAPPGGPTFSLRTPPGMRSRRQETTATAALEFQDWLEVAGSVMADVSEQSSQWWASVVAMVSKTYATWLSATPLERLQIGTVGSERLCEGRWVRVNARVSAMLLNAMGDDLKKEMISQRLTQDTPRMLFRLHTLYQPGGGAERHEMLRRLQMPSDYLTTGDGIDDVIALLRAWPRWLARCQAVGMSPPDPTVLTKGLASLTDRHIQASADAAFRTAMLRTTLRLDGQPTLDQVVAYQRHLQAELEVLAAGTTKSTATPKVRAADATGSSPTTGKIKDKAGAELCKYFMKASGCRRGARCNYSHSMTTLDRETRARKCLQCGAEGHRQKDCPVGKGGSKGKPASGSSPTTTRTSEAGASPSATAVAAEDKSLAGAPVQGVPWTLDSLVQAAQQIVQAQATSPQAGEPDKSPEKTPSMRVLIVKDIRVCSLRTTTALLDSGATHALRSARSWAEWEAAEEVELAGSHSLQMKINEAGTLLMAPKDTAQNKEAQTIVPMGDLVRTLGYTLHWSPKECLLLDSEGVQAPLNVNSGCPQLCEAEALALIACLEERKKERLENETLATEDRIAKVAAGLDKSWFEYLMHYTNSGAREPGLRALRDAPFLCDLPGECLGGMVPQELPERGWDVLRPIDFLTRPQRRALLAAKRWVIHFCAGKDSHLDFFKLERGDTVVLELDLDRCRGHDLLGANVWRMLMWGAREGRIDLLFGGPPGRSGLMDALQHHNPAAIKSLTVIARMLWLYVVATAGRLTRATGSNRRRSVGFFLEHPGEDTKRGGLWQTPMWRSFEEESGQYRVSFDQQGMGSKCSTPTTIGTNISYLHALKDIRGTDMDQDDEKGEKNARWSPGLVKAMLVAFHLWGRSPSLMAVSDEVWKSHVDSNHHPYRRDCLTCVMSKGLGRRHARVCHPDAFVVTSDLTGPIRPGLDPMIRGSLTKSMKYILVARYTFPTECLKAYRGGDLPEGPGLHLPEEGAGAGLDDNEGFFDEGRPRDDVGDHQEPLHDLPDYIVPDLDEPEGPDLNLGKRWTSYLCCQRRRKRRRNPANRCSLTRRVRRRSRKRTRQIRSWKTAIVFHRR